MSATPRTYRTSCPVIKVPVPAAHTIASLKKLYSRCPECDRNWPKTPDDDSRSCRSGVSSITMRMQTTTGGSSVAPSGLRTKAPAPALPWESPSAGKRSKSPTSRKPSGVPSRTRSYPPRHSCCSENEDPGSDVEGTNRQSRRTSSVKPNYGTMRKLKPNETYSLIERNDDNICSQDSDGSLGLDDACCSHEPSLWWRFRSFFRRSNRHKRRGRRPSVTWSRSPSVCYIPDK